MKSVRFIERVEKLQEAVEASVTNDSVSYIQFNQSSLTHQIKVKIKKQHFHNKILDSKQSETERVLERSYRTNTQKG